VSEAHEDHREPSSSSDSVDRNPFAAPRTSPQSVRRSAYVFAVVTGLLAFDFLVTVLAVSAISDFSPFS